MDTKGIRYSFANDENGNRTYISEAKKGGKYTCPLCGSKMIPKLGKIKRHHYAHESESKCDEWYGNKGEWHIEMQEMFDKEYREVVVTVGDEKHIADICIEKPCGQKLVIEFQKSPITKEEFIRRTYFWKVKAGADIIWVFNYAQDGPKRNNRFQRFPEKKASSIFNYSETVHYRWRRPSAPFVFPLISVPVFFYINAEEDCKWIDYSEYRGESIKGKFVQKEFYLLVQYMCYYDREEDDFSGARVSGKRYNDSSFWHFVMSDRLDRYIPARMPEYENVIVDTKDRFQASYFINMCDEYCINKSSDKQVYKTNIKIVYSDESIDYDFLTSNEGISEKDISFIRSIVGDNNVRIEDTYCQKEDMVKNDNTLYRSKFGGIVINVTADEYNRYANMYINKESDHWLLTTAIIKETGDAEYMYLPISRDEFVGVKNNAIEREDLAKKYFPERDVHCPELMIYGFQDLPDKIDEMNMLRPSDYNIPSDGYEVLLSEGCVVPGERGIKMRVADTRVSYRKIIFSSHGLMMEGPREVWNFMRVKCNGDLEYMSRFFYQKANDKNVVA